jgi:hypothetical protein
MLDAPAIVPPRTPTCRLAVAEAPEDPLNEQDQQEAFDIVTDPVRIPERRHLVALAKAWDEAVDLVVATGAFIDIAARERRKDH